MSVGFSCVGSSYDTRLYSLPVNKGKPSQDEGVGKQTVANVDKYSSVESASGVRQAMGSACVPNKVDKVQDASDVGGETEKFNFIDGALMIEQIDLLESYLRLLLPKSELSLGDRYLEGVGDAEQRKYLLELMERLDASRSGNAGMRGEEGINFSRYK